MIKILLVAMLCSARLSFGFVSQKSGTVRVPTFKNFKTGDHPGQCDEAAIARSKPRIVTINSEEEFEAFLNEDDRLCLVKFYATWCKACKAFGRQYERIGNNVGDLESKDGCIVKEGEVRLAQIEFGANSKFCRSLGVRKVPSMYFFSQGKKVDGFPSGPKKIAHTLEKLNHYRSLSLQELSFEADMNEGEALGEDIMSKPASTEKEKRPIP